MKWNPHKNLFISFCLYLLTFFVCAQEPIYQNLTVDDGLPSSQVYDIYQDAEGYIWFATDRGLSRYNGYEFENFGVNDGLTGNVVLQFFPQKDGKVWCYNFFSKSLFFFESPFNGFTPYKYNSKLSEEITWRNAMVKSLYIGKHEDVHLGGHLIDGELIITNYGDIINVHPSSAGNNTSDIIFLNIDKSRNDFFFTNNTGSPYLNFSMEKNKNIIKNFGVQRFSCNQDRILIHKTDKTLLVEDGKVKKVINTEFKPLTVEILNDHFFLVGYLHGGAKVFDLEGNIIEEFLKDKSITNFLVDHEGGYWFTTLNSGVFYAKNPKIKTVKRHGGNLNNQINSIVKDSNNRLFVGLQNGEINQVKNNEILPYIASTNVLPSVVEFSVFHNSMFWYNSSLHAFDKLFDIRYTTKLSENCREKIFATHISSYTEITSSGTFEEVRLPMTRLNDVNPWKNEILLGCNSGLYKKTKDTIVDLRSLSSALQYRIEDIDVDQKNERAYLATIGGGLVVYGDSIFKISEEEGLASSLVNEVFLEDNNTIWTCTNKGISRVVFNADQSYKVNNINNKDGLISNETEDIEIINDTVWVATNKGICFFPKSILEKKDSIKEFLQIKRVYSSNKDYTSFNNPELDYKKNNISFLIQNISYYSGSNLNYNYRLNGLHTDWINTKNRTVTFSNLVPGKYTFELRGKKGVNNIITYPFSIAPPLWKTWWFKLLMLSGISGVIYFIFRIRLLNYNNEIARELWRILLKRVKKEERYFVFREAGVDIRVKSNEILFVKAAGNYIDIITEDKTYTLREKISAFITLIPDPLEYVRIHRKYIVRIDKVQKKTLNNVFIQNYELPIGKKYLSEAKRIIF